jgi:hypothetical protein
LRFHDGATGEIFRGNQLDIFALAPFLRRNRVGDLGIDLTKRLT